MRRAVMTRATRVSLNGTLVPQDAAQVPITDRGFLYGDAVFETVAVYAGRPFRLDAHLQRLDGSMKALRFPLPADVERLRSEAGAVIEANRLSDGLLRICVTRGRGPRGLDARGATNPTVIVSAHPPPQTVMTLADTGARLAVSDIRRVPPQCLPAHAKHANMLNGILANGEAVAAGAYEALMLTVDGHLAECSFSNLFFVHGGRLCTPALSLGILPGITRAAVIEMARRNRLQVEEGTFDLPWLEGAEEAFITNTSAGVLPVATIGEQRLRAPGPVTAALRNAYWQLVEAEAGPRWGRAVTSS